MSSSIRPSVRHRHRQALCPGGGTTMKELPAKKVIKTIHRQAMFPAKTLTTEEGINAYVEKIRANMKQLLHGCDGIKLI